MIWKKIKSIYTWIWNWICARTSCLIPNHFLTWHLVLLSAFKQWSLCSWEKAKLNMKQHTAYWLCGCLPLYILHSCWQWSWEGGGRLGITETTSCSTDPNITLKFAKLNDGFKIAFIIGSNRSKMQLTKLLRTVSEMWKKVWYADKSLSCAEVENWHK